LEARCKADIALEEFSPLEMVGKLVEMHTTNVDQTSAFKSSLFSVRGMGPHFVDSNGVCWSAAYINEGGNVVRDLRCDIASEAGARQTYEALIKIAPDNGTKKTLHTLLTREIAHTKMFMAALESLGKLDDPMFGNVPPDDTVNLYFNLSKGEDEDIRGPWNDDGAVEYLADPQPRGGPSEDPTNPDDEGSAAGPKGGGVPKKPKKHARAR
jgi:Mn-containing catalase